MQLPSSHSNWSGRQVREAAVGAGGGGGSRRVSRTVPADPPQQARSGPLRRLLTTVDLVTAVFAVGVPVAAPLLVDALAGAALGLAGRALGVHHGLAAALLQRLVGLVGAVGVVVAQPAAGDAGRGAAPELVRAARRGRARLLVAAVAAVVLAVADEIPGDAAAAGAGELVGAARDVACSAERAEPAERAGLVPASRASPHGAVRGVSSRPLAGPPSFT